MVLFTLGDPDYTLFSCSAVSDSLEPCPWDFSGKNARVGCHLDYLYFTSVEFFNIFLRVDENGSRWSKQDFEKRTITEQISPRVNRHL